jgi:hypothetical protein
MDFQYEHVNTSNGEPFATYVTWDKRRDLWSDEIDM